MEIATQIFGRVQITAHSAGYSIGSANWAIEIADKRLVYVGTSSLATDRPPMPLDVEALRNADVCVLGGLASRTNATPPHERMAELLRHVAGTVAAGSPVLLPVRRDCVRSVLPGHLRLGFYSESCRFDIVRAFTRHVTRRAPSGRKSAAGFALC